MSMANIHEDDFGFEIRLTVKQDDTALDISEYTTKQFLLTDPGGNTATKTADFKTDGEDGVLTYTVASGDIDEAGVWQLQVCLKYDTDAEIHSTKINFTVL